MWAIVLVGLIITFALVAVCIQLRRRGRGEAGPLPVAAPATAAATPSGRQRHVVAAAAAAAAGAPGSPAGSDELSAVVTRRGFRSKKLPTPHHIITNLPTYVYTLPASAVPKAVSHPASDDTAAEPDQERPSAAAPAVAGCDGGEDARPVCVICCEPFQEGCTVKLLPCMHGFCSDCIDAWLERDTHCPCCMESGEARCGSIGVGDALRAFLGVQLPGMRRRAGNMG
jgi:hypothetical protein